MEAVRFARNVALMDLFPWQEHCVRDTFAERWVPGADAWHEGVYRWAATDIGVIVARQNGKGDYLLAVALYQLFVLKVRRIFWTAQLQKTATDAHVRMAAILRGAPKLMEQVRSIRYGKGDERVVLNDGREILFFTRSDDAGRGLFGDVLILDESYDLTDGELAALRPLIKTSPNPMVIYTSTPVDGEVHTHGMVLSRVRKRALTGTTPRLAWLEFSVPPRFRDEQGRTTGPDTRLTDPAMLARGNPSLGYLFGAETLEDDLTSMGMRKFLVEDLCAPDYWPDPDEIETEDAPFNSHEFSTTGVSSVPMLDPIALGVDRSPDGRTALVAAGWTADGVWASETLYHRDGIDWVVDVVEQLVAAFEPAILVLDAASPAGAVLAKLRAAGLDPIVTGTAEMARACQALVDDHGSGRYVHRGADAPLLEAVEVARWRPLGDARAFARKGHGDISPLVATALAGFGLNLVVAEGPPPPGAQLEPVDLPLAAGGAEWYGAGESFADPSFADF